MAPAGDLAAKAQGREGPAVLTATRARGRAQEMEAAAALEQWVAGQGLVPAVDQLAPAQRVALVAALPSERQVLARLARPPVLQPAAAQVLAQAVEQLAQVQGAAQAAEHPATKAHTLAQSRAAELSNEDRELAHLEAEGHAEAVPAAWAQVAPAGKVRPEPADRATQEAVFRLGPQKTKTSWEF